MRPIHQHLAPAVAAAALFCVLFGLVASPARAAGREDFGNLIINIDSKPRDFEQPHPDDPTRVIIRLSEPVAVPVAVQLTTEDGTAVAPDDYLPLHQPVTVPAGDQSVMVALQLVDDGVEEPAEWFAVTLSSPSAGRIGLGRAEITIVDGSPPGRG